jgi:hypothetical protein
MTYEYTTLGEISQLDFIHAVLAQEKGISAQRRLILEQKVPTRILCMGWPLQRASSNQVAQTGFSFLYRKQAMPLRPIADDPPWVHIHGPHHFYDHD